MPAQYVEIIPVNIFEISVARACRLMIMALIEIVTNRGQGEMIPCSRNVGVRILVSAVAAIQRL